MDDQNDTHGLTTPQLLWQLGQQVKFLNAQLLVANQRSESLEHRLGALEDKVILLVAVFEPVRIAVYGLIVLILVAFAGAVIGRIIIP